MSWTIHKYPVELTDDFSVEMPMGAEILDVQVQRGSPQMWAMVDTKKKMQKRLFRLVGTGHLISDEDAMNGAYIRSFQMNGGDLVLHLFEVVAP